MKVNPFFRYIFKDRYASLKDTAAIRAIKLRPLQSMPPITAKTLLNKPDGSINPFCLKSPPNRLSCWVYRSIFCDEKDPSTSPDDSGWNKKITAYSRASPLIVASVIDFQILLKRLSSDGFPPQRQVFLFLSEINLDRHARKIEVFTQLILNKSLVRLFDILW